MAKYGILRADVNTGLDTELISVFTAPLSISSNKPRYMSETITLKRKSVYSDVQRWEISAGIAPTLDGREQMLHLVKNSYDGRFQIRMPQIYTKVSVNDSLQRVTTAHALAGDTTVSIVGGGSQILPIGHFIKFAGHTKVYLVEASTGPVGNVNTITVTPPLHKSVTSAEVVSCGAKVTMTAYYDTSTMSGVSYADGILTDAKAIGLIEAL